MIDPKKLRMETHQLEQLVEQESARLTVLADSPPFKVEPWVKAPEIVRGIVEIPKGSRNKYELDKRTGLIGLDRHVSTSVQYPVDYGIIPRTLLGDGDPLDILLIVQEPTFPGCLVSARVVGLFLMFEKGAEDYKVLAVPCADPLQSHYRTLADVPEAFLREVEHFFNTYKELEGGKIETFGWSDASDARLVIDESHRRWEEGRRILGAGAAVAPASVEIE